MDPEDFFIPEWTSNVKLPAGNVLGIFDKSSMSAALGIGINASQPQVALLSDDAGQLEEGDELIITNARTGELEYYNALAFAPDGEGITIVDLEDA